MNAKQEATRRMKNNDGLNAIGGQCEWAYSPSKNTVGMREAGTESPYRIINVNYPFYGNANLVDDWISVGTEKPKKNWHWKHSYGCFIQQPNHEGREYIIVNGHLIDSKDQDTLKILQEAA